MAQFGMSCVKVGVLRQEVFVDGVRVERITGIDMIHWLCGQSVMRGKKVFLLGGRPATVVEKVKCELSRTYPEVMFECDCGHQNIKEVMSLQVSGIDAKSEQIVAKINEFGAEVLLVAYGHPWQDLWLDKVRDELRTVRLAGGVGGAFDFIAGNVPRAPVWMRSRGLEWIYRLSQQPERLPRILNATWRFGLILVT
jgi:N-acetylglucosaminyldiphosphoundecaprenol N-acetyl-beta-D-mannosaminyltransferase